LQTIVNVEPIKISVVENNVLYVFLLLFVIMLVRYLHQVHVNVEPFKILAVENYALLVVVQLFVMRLVLILTQRIVDVALNLMDVVLCAVHVIYVLR